MLTTTMQDLTKCWRLQCKL